MEVFCLKKDYKVCQSLKKVSSRNLTKLDPREAYSRSQHLEVNIHWMSPSALVVSDCLSLVLNFVLRKFIELKLFQVSRGWGGQSLISCLPTIGRLLTQNLRVSKSV